MKPIFAIILVLFCCVLVVKCKQEDAKVDADGKKIKPVDIYRKLLRTKRNAHREAVATMLKLGDKYEKQYMMVAMMLQQIVKISEEKKQVLEKVGFKPDDPYPEEEDKREAVSMVIENTAFLGDIALHLPDITHEILDKQRKEWDSTVQWCVDFTNKTKILDKNDQKMLNLMAQELNIIEKAENFHNPYREETLMEQVVEEEMDRILKEQKKKEERRNKRNKNRGPSLGGARTEL